MTLEAVGIGRIAEGRTLLEDVSLVIRGGQRVALVGPSGSGKTLLLRSLAMLDPIDSGQVHWKGRARSANEVPKFRSRALYLHQTPSLHEGTVEENLRTPYSLGVHRDKTFDRARLINMLDSLGRTDSFLSKSQRDLSGGEAQIAAILRAVQLDPEFLLLDEPTAALDARATEMIESFLTHWHDQQHSVRATVWVTHDEEQAKRVANSVLHIYDGRLLRNDRETAQ